MAGTLTFHFIYYAKCEAECLDSLKSIEALTIPRGYNISTIILQGNYSIIDGYNFALRNSLAKYKIYLHKNLKIINRNFLSDVLSLFTRYPQLGMLGVIGALKLPHNGNWWDASNRCGKILFRGQQLNQPLEVVTDYQPVEAIDGKIMITQYDIRWRNDRFTEPYFYDTAQSLEFIKAGLQVGVPYQKEPWCAYENPQDVLFCYHQDREIFVQEYRDLIG